MQILFFFYMAVFVCPPRPHRLRAAVHSASYTLGHDMIGLFLSTIPTRSPHIVVVLAPLRITAIIILLLLLPVSIVPIAAILAVAIVALALTLVVVVRLLVFIDVIVL